MKRGDTVRVQVERITPKGAGFAELEGRAFEIRGAIPGDVVDVRIMSLKRHSAWVSIERIVDHSIDRVSVGCPHFRECGGCVWQDVPYAEQCRLKASLVRTALGSIPGVEPVQDIELIPSPDVFFYRNKMEFSWDSPPSAGGIVMLGLHEAGRFDRIFDLKRCLLQSELSNRVVEVSRDFVMRYGLTAYGLKSHTGLLRFLMVRDGKNTGDLMVNLVTSGEEFPDSLRYARHVLEELPEVTTIVRSINRRKGSVAVGEECEVLHGDGFITDRIGDCMFTISPDSFFQTNTIQAQNLYDTIRTFCRLDGTQHILDLYCGTGTISIYCSEGARTVTGIEAVDRAVEDARRNSELNGVTNSTFISGQVEKLLHESIQDFDVVICDPPRAGIHPKALNHLLRMRIPRMVYVSCNVRAMTADLEMLAMAGYCIRQVRVFDMSPHTPHVETVILLEIVQ